MAGAGADCDVGKIGALVGMGDLDGDPLMARN